MFCDKCGMPLAICICNILPIIAPEGQDKQVKQITVEFTHQTSATYRPAKVKKNEDDGA